MLHCGRRIRPDFLFSDPNRPKGNTQHVLASLADVNFNCSGKKDHKIKKDHEKNCEKNYSDLAEILHATRLDGPIVESGRIL